MYSLLEEINRNRDITVDICSILVGGLHHQFIIVHASIYTVYALAYKTLYRRMLSSHHRPAQTFHYQACGIDHNYQFSQPHLESLKTRLRLRYNRNAIITQSPLKFFECIHHLDFFDNLRIEQCPL